MIHQHKNLSYFVNHSRKVKNGFSNGQTANTIRIDHLEDRLLLETIIGMGITPDKLTKINELIKI